MTQSDKKTEQIRFFTVITASATHEVKNILSIINENAGFLNDLSELSQTNPEKPLTHDRVNTCTERIQQQVQRAAMVMKNLNRFSHSNDQEETTFDLIDTIAFVLTLTGRLIDITGKKVNFTPPSSPVVTRMNQMALYHILWLMIDGALAASQEQSDIQIEINTAQNSKQVRFFIASPTDNCFNIKTQLKKDILAMSGMDLEIQTNDCSFELNLPAA